MRRGEVWWHEPPDEKPQPVLVLTRDDVSAEKVYLTQRITELGAAKMEAACLALATATSCKLMASQAPPI